MNDDQRGSLENGGVQQLEAHADGQRRTQGRNFFHQEARGQGGGWEKLISRGLCTF